MMIDLLPGLKFRYWEDDCYILQVPVAASEAFEKLYAEGIVVDLPDDTAAWFQEVHRQLVRRANQQAIFPVDDMMGRSSFRPTGTRELFLAGWKRSRAGVTSKH